MLYKSNLLTLEQLDIVGIYLDGYWFMSPSGRLYSYKCYIGLFGTGFYRFYIWVELPVQRRLCPIFVKNVESLDIHEYSAG